MSESATMEWRNEACRVVIFDLHGDEADFRRFMSNLRIGIDEESLHAPVQRYLRSLLDGRDIEITARPDFYRPGTLYEVRPVSGLGRVLRMDSSVFPKTPHEGLAPAAASSSAAAQDQGEDRSAR